MKIKVSQLSNRVHEVKVTNRILRNTLKYQLSMAESDDVEDKSFTEQLHASLNAVNSNTDFIIDTLNLNKAEKEKLDDLSFAETVKIATRVALRVQGLSDEDIDMSAKKADASKSEDEDN
ncbi:phage tail tube assembly chaperone [Lacticaseibacillus paracasei]|uniref:phage tail tube assembly chaperone n=1 Tax=Lacticaseibacillus paracasei TaxID=1597 RepID=UPI0034E5152B